MNNLQIDYRYKWFYDELTRLKSEKIAQKEKFSTNYSSLFSNMYLYYEIENLSKRISLLHKYFNGIIEVDEEGAFLWLVTLALIVVFSVLITAPVVYVFRILKDESFRSIINLKCNIIWTSAVMIILFGWFVLAFYLAMWDEIVRESEWVFTDMIVDNKNECSFGCCFINEIEEGTVNEVNVGPLLKNCLELKEMNVEGNCIFNGEVRSTVCGECYEPMVTVSYFDGDSELVSSVFGESCDMGDRDCLDSFLGLYPEVDGSFGGYYNKNNSLDVMYSIVDRNDALGWTIIAAILIVGVAVAQWLMIWNYNKKKNIGHNYI
jgi:hypothetical protein